MQTTIASILGLALLCSISAAGAGKKPPAKLVFPSKAGEIAFDHAAHAKREKGNCKRCHDKLWPRPAKVALTSSAGCRSCHTAGGASFEMKGNCKKCHAGDPEAASRREQATKQ